MVETKSKRVLVVDDEKDIQKLIKTALEQDGYDVQVASSAEEALEMDINHSFHVYILDLNLPEMSGIELCKIIKNHNPVSLVYAITGYSSIFELVTCRETGFEDYFSKPVSMDILREAVRYAISQINRWSANG